MKINKGILFLLIFAIFIFGIASISANSDLNETISIDNSKSDIECNSGNVLKSSNYEESVLADSPKTIEVPFVSSQPNEVLWPRIQPAIDKANPGDTVIIKGNPVHCHITINKTLNVVAQTGGTIGPCPHHTHEGVDEFGVFYVAEGGSGSVIQGFTFLNNDKSETPFSILIMGANDVTIKDCTMNYVNNDVDKYCGIIIENSNNILLSNILINNTINGITIINSTNVDITDCTMSNNENQAINIYENSKNININNNFIFGNGYYGVKLLSADNIFINNNMIKNNGFNNSDSGSGIYVNTNITKLVVMGNIFLANNLHAIMYDYHCRNLDKSEGADKLTLINDNYFEGHNSMILHHRVYVERSYGDMIYDVETDTFKQSDNGNYVEGKSYVYMQNAFIVNDIPCGFTYYTTDIPWTIDSPSNNGKYDLLLGISNIKEIQNGVYQISIVDSKGQVATNFNFGYIMFFLNGYSTINPQSDDTYIKAPIKDGVAISDFRNAFQSFNVSGNVITAAFPGLSSKVESNQFTQLNIKDSNIPINPATSLSSSGLILYPLATDYISVKLVDSKNNPIAGQTVTFKFNGKTYIPKTDRNGIAKVKVSFSSKKTYVITFAFGGTDNYKASKTTSKIIVKTGSKKSKIQSSNMKVKKNKKKTFKFKLTSSNGKALANQKVIVKVNGKTKTLKTNKKGMAKLSVKFKKVKKYKVNIKFLGNAQYKPVSKVNTIAVTKK